MILTDIIILGFIAIGAIVGFYRGFFREIVETVGVLVAAVAANLISPQVRQWAELVVSGEKAVSVVAWIAIFVLVLIALALAARLLNAIFSKLYMGWLVRLAGAVFGAIKYLLIAAVIVTAIEYAYEHVDLLGETPQWMQDSQLIPPINKLAHTLYYSIVQ